MQLPIAVNETERATRQNQCCEQIRVMSAEGGLKAGDPIPATRELSLQMGISRNTALLAYERLISEGYVYTKPYVGTFVSDNLHDRVAPRLVDGQDAPQSESCQLLSLNDAQRLRQFVRIHSLQNPHRNRLSADFLVGRPDPE